MTTVIEDNHISLNQDNDSSESKASDSDEDYWKTFGSNRQEEKRLNHNKYIKEYYKKNSEYLIPYINSYRKPDAKAGSQTMCKFCGKTYRHDYMGRHNITITHITNFINY